MSRQVRYCVVCETARVFTGKPPTCTWCGFEDERNECRLLSKPATSATSTPSTLSVLTGTTSTLPRVATVASLLGFEKSLSTTLFGTLIKELVALEKVVTKTAEWMDTSLVGQTVSVLLLLIIGYFLMVMALCM